MNDAKSTAATIDEQGWLHTGDIGYVDHDDEVFIVDRLKELIKFKGFQVHLLNNLSTKWYVNIYVIHQSAGATSRVGGPSREPSLYCGCCCCPVSSIYNKLIITCM